MGTTNPGENGASRCAAIAAPLGAVVYAVERCGRDRTSHPAHKLDGREVYLMAEKTRQLLEDKYVLNMSDAEIASALGVKPSSVRMLLTRARSKARKAIEKKM